VSALAAFKIDNVGAAALIAWRRITTARAPPPAIRVTRIIVYGPTHHQRRAPFVHTPIYFSRPPSRRLPAAQRERERERENTQKTPLSCAKKNLLFFCHHRFLPRED